ncbi:MAG: hypothetical protein ACLRZ5_01675 [Ruminococcus sp.]
MGGNFDYGRKFIQRIDLGAKTKITDIAGRIETFHSDSMGCNIRDRTYDTRTFRQYPAVGTLESIGEELESAALDTFLKYPEFALNYSSRLESDLITSNTISSDDAEENFKQLYEKMRHSTYAKFQYDIGA